METHPQKAEDMPIGDDLAVVVRTIDPILDQLIDGAFKGALHADDLVDIAVRIRSILHEAVARQGGGADRMAAGAPTGGASAAGTSAVGASVAGASVAGASVAGDAALLSGAGG